MIKDKSILLLTFSFPPLFFSEASDRSSSQIFTFQNIGHMTIRHVIMLLDQCENFIFHLCQDFNIIIQSMNKAHRPVKLSMIRAYEIAPSA